MPKRLDAIESKLVNVEAKGAKQVELGAHVENVQEAIENLEKKLTDLQDRSSWNNLVIFGIKESADETPDALLTMLNDYANIY